MARIVLEHATKAFEGPPGHRVSGVEDLSFAVQDRELVVLVGPSGCGKTTTLRLIAGLEKLNSGSIYIDGRCVNGVEPRDRDMAMVFQNHALYPHMTVYANMAFGLRLRHMSSADIERRVQAAADLLGLGTLFERLPHELSGGQRQRVAVGRAIVRHPKAFLFDEPLSNLDAQMRGQMRLEIKRFHRQLSATLIYVTHDQVEAMTLGDRIIVMRAGRIEQAGPPLALYDQPLNLFVAGFLGCPPMNLIAGRLEDAGGAPRFLLSPAGMSPDHARHGCRIPLDPLQFSGLALAPFLGKPVLFGIRPEHLQVVQPASVSAPGTIPGQVEFTEPLGAESFVHLEVIGHRVVARIPNAPSDFHRGDRVCVIPDPSRVRLFDGATGRRLP